MIIARIALAVAAVALVSRALSALPASAQAVPETRDISFPVEGRVSFSDDYGDGRSGGRTHEGNDLSGAKMQPLLSAVDGWVQNIVDPEESWGCAITLVDADGWTYHYLHVNNDTPGTDDGIGCAQYAYAPGLEEGGWGRRGPSRGTSVTRGQVIAYMGDSGNAENTSPHLHFEIRRPDDTPINPYASLVAARDANRFDPSAARAAAPDINTDKSLIAPPFPGNCESGTRIKTASSKAVYYCGADGKRYVFPNDKTYFTWYADFAGVVTVSDETLASLQLGGNVTYRPGVKMVKITSDPKVYAVDRGGTLRWVESAEIATALYGANWFKMVEDVSDAFFINYAIGNPISQP